ncbi:MAG: polysaccharide biosynthesis protein [Anaerolineae bacterium]|nr:polysaccharide biosynthesis protein [Anaerolineae bacterium]
MLRSGLKQFLAYSIGSLAQAALGFLLLPLYLNRLTTAEYGIVSVLLTLNSVVSLVAGSGVLSGLSRLYYEQSIESRRRMAGTTIAWMCGASMIVALLMIAASGPLSVAFFDEAYYADEIRTASVLLLISALQASLYVLLRLEKRAIEFVTISIAGFLVELALKAYLIGTLHQGVEGYFVSSIFSATLTTLMSIAVLRGCVVLSFKHPMLRALLTLGFPFIFTGLGMWILDISDRLILEAFAGSELVGVYTLGYKFASVFNIVLLGPLSLFWTPFIFSFGAERGEEAMRIAHRQAFIVLTLAGSLLLVGISAGSADVIYMFTQNSAYYPASRLVPFLSLAPFLYMLSYPAGSAILQSKQVRYAGYAMGAAALINLSLNLILIPHFSVYGATATTVIGYLVLCALQYYWAQRVFPAPYDWVRAIKIVGCSALSVLVVEQVHLAPPVVSFLVREGLGVLIFISAMWFIRGIRMTDILLVKNLARQLITQLYASPISH